MRPMGVAGFEFVEGNGVFAPYVVRLRWRREQAMHGVECSASRAVESGAIGGRRLINSRPRTIRRTSATVGWTVQRSACGPGRPVS